MDKVIATIVAWWARSPYLKSLAAIAIGGASASVVHFLNTDQGTISKIDWHQMGIAAGHGALLALCMYLAKSPLGGSYGVDS